MSVSARIALGAAVGLGLCLAAGVWWALFHQVREVEVLGVLPCAEGPLEVRRVTVQRGHTPLSFPVQGVELGGLQLAVDRAPVGWVDDSELPARIETRPLGPDEQAWMVYAQDAQLAACAAAGLEELRTVLGGEVVVWRGAAGDVWPVFRTPEGEAVRVRRDGAIEVEAAIDGGFVTRRVGALVRDASGERARVLSERDPALARATDGRGRTLFERFPARDDGLRSPDEIEALLPRVALERPSR